MSNKSFKRAVLPVVLCLPLFAVAASAQDAKKDVMVGPHLSKGFDMGVDSSEKERKWIRKLPEYMEMSFPAHQEWAAVFITVGKPRDGKRPWMDFSSYKSLSIEMRGEKGGEVVEVGVKSDVQPDDGTEAKSTVTLTPEWKTYTFALSEFKGADLSHLYVVAEFVYNNSTPQNVHFRNIKYLS